MGYAYYDHMNQSVENINDSYSRGIIGAIVYGHVINSISIPQTDIGQSDCFITDGSITDSSKWYKNIKQLLI